MCILEGRGAHVAPKPEAELGHFSPSQAQFSCSILFDCLQPHELQHARLPCTSPTPRDCSTHVHWVRDAIQPSHPLSSPSPPAFNLSQHQGLFQWVSSSLQVAQVLGVSASASVLPMNIQDWFPLGWTSLISLQSKGLSRVFLLQHHSSKASISGHSAFFITQLSHPYMTSGKTTALTRRTFVGKVMSLFFNRLSRLVIAFLPRNKRLLISWLQSPSIVFLEPKKIKSVTVSPSTAWAYLI